MYQVPGATAGDVQTMLALFGATTLATNTASFNRNAAKAEDAFADDTDAVKARFEAITPAAWGTKKGGGIGIDLEALFAAVTEVKGAEPADGHDTWISKMADPEMVDVRRQLRNHSKIGAIYDRIVREKRATVGEADLDELLNI